MTFSVHMQCLLASGPSSGASWMKWLSVTNQGFAFFFVGKQKPFSSIRKITDLKKSMLHVGGLSQDFLIRVYLVYLDNLFYNCCITINVSVQLLKGSEEVDGDFNDLRHQSPCLWTSVMSSAVFFSDH